MITFVGTVDSSLSFSLLASVLLIIKKIREVIIVLKPVGGCVGVVWVLCGCCVGGKGGGGVAVKN